MHAWNRHEEPPDRSKHPASWKILHGQGSALDACSMWGTVASRSPGGAPLRCRSVAVGLIRRWREIRACTDNAWGESKGQNSHESLLDLTFWVTATDPKAAIYQTSFRASDYLWSQ